MPDLGAIHEDVPFAWEASRRLQARLRAVAEELDAQAGSRRAFAAEAVPEWRGVYRVQFDGRTTTCVQDARRLADGMRLAARQVGELRRLAEAEQERREAARRWERAQREESLLEKAGDLLFGEDDLPPVPPPIDPPRWTVPAPAAGSRG